MNATLLTALVFLGGITGQEVPQSVRPLHPVNLNCGIRPIPPIGCQVGPCVCDQTGTNCQWQFICN
jgi:hypothetical protein